MEEAMEKDCIEIATYALYEFQIEKDMANHIKKELDKKYRCAGPLRAASFFLLRFFSFRRGVRSPHSPFLSRCCRAAARHGTW